MSSNADLFERPHFICIIFMYKTHTHTHTHEHTHTHHIYMYYFIIGVIRIASDTATYGSIRQHTSAYLHKACSRVGKFKQTGDFVSKRHLMVRASCQTGTLRHAYSKYRLFSNLNWNKVFKILSLVVSRGRWGGGVGWFSRPQKDYSTKKSQSSQRKMNERLTTLRN